MTEHNVSTFLNVYKTSINYNLYTFTLSLHFIRHFSKNLNFSWLHLHLLLISIKHLLLISKKVFGLGSYFHESYVNEFNRIQLYLDR